MTRKAPTCQICDTNEAEWAMQYVASDRPSFSSLGSHYRGFPVTKVCDPCKEGIIALDRAQAKMEPSIGPHEEP